MAELLKQTVLHDEGANADHINGEFHHHHSHTHGSKHVGGHHLLQVEDLSVSFRMYESNAPFFHAKQRFVEVLSNLSISVHAGEIIAVVGASGSGKTVLADAIMGNFEPNAQVSGSIWFDGELLSETRLVKLRGSHIALVPQSVSYLDPLMKVGQQVEGVVHNAEDARCRSARRQQLFARFGLGEEVALMYPHELSGGMARRVLLCCALIENPQLIIADEPTPGLDLPLAIRAMEDFRAFANEGGGVVLITHDIELALRCADRVAVFQNGTIVEETSVQNFASSATLAHPFSKALWHALPEHNFEEVGND